LCRDYIHGIGNLDRHLRQLGINVSFEQSPLEELDFFVTNLATDLRDGVRLGKLAEILGNQTGIIAQMRIPAISRLQKVFNVGVALSALSDLGVSEAGKIHPNYIVDGHRPQVLKILWSITSSFNLSNVLDNRKLKEEIYTIQRSKRKLNGPIQFSAICGDIDSCEDICDLLLVWCDAICSSYNLEVTNFSASFADGRAVCFLISFYLPCMLHLDDILPTHSSSKNYVTSHQGGNTEDLLQNERMNCSLARQKMIEIGGIPNILPISDTSNIPDERTMIITVGYLCSRLLETSKEMNAVLVIQTAVRLYLGRSKMRQLRYSVNVIEKAWIAYRNQYFKQQKLVRLKPLRVIESFLVAKRPIFQKSSRQRFASIYLQVSTTIGKEMD
jgi:abnormal spindle-like microcephaly-associated protein